MKTPLGFLLALFFVLSAPPTWGEATRIQKFVVIIPVYRELYSQNIGAVIDSLYRQNLKGLGIDKLDVWFVVNNTVDAPDPVKVENRETVELLNRLAAGTVPPVFHEHQLLRAIGNAKVHQRLNIHVLDLTNPGRPNRNIGEVRDLGLKAALEDVDPHTFDHTLVALMDADTEFGSNYARTVIRAIEHGGLKFALNTMYYSDQTESELRVYQRKITSDYMAAVHGFRMAQDGWMPAGGGPRIVATAQAMKEVGGIPHEVVGEDTKLITLLREKFPKHGRFIDNPVFARYRARDDGYDAAIYKRRLNDPIQFSEYELQTTNILNETLRYFERDSTLSLLYKEAIQQETHNYRTEVLRLRGLIGVLISDSYLELESTTPAAHYPPLMGNFWFKELLIQKTQQFGHDDELILDELTTLLPHHLSLPPRAETQSILKMIAATRVLLHMPFVRDPLLCLTYLPTLHEQFPKTYDAIRASIFEKATQQLLTHDVATETLLALLRVKDLPGFDLHVRPLLKAAVLRHLNKVTKLSDFDEEKYTKVKDLIHFVDYRLIDPTLLKLRQERMASMRLILERPTQGLAALLSPRVLSERTTMTLFWEEITTRVKASGLKLHEPAVREFFQPLVALYRQGLDSNSPSFMDAEENQRFRHIESLAKPNGICALLLTP